MISLALAIALTLVSGCAAVQGKLGWRVKDIVLTPSATVNLYGPDERIIASVPTRAIQHMMLAHLRISAAANVQTDLFIVEGDEPNAFAGLNEGRRIVGINLGMIKLIGERADEYAALLGHEAAHWAKGHVDSGQMRSQTLKTAGALVGAGLGLAGVPAAGLIGSLGFDLIEASYSREQEREADAQSIEYVLAGRYDPHGALRLHEKLINASSGLPLPFLSSHPSGEERMKNLRSLIDAKSAPR
ncbi:MAG TPA: M48 family metalloprotease [Verrucomicrobiae bacterium]|nr:M48 family metalloprotease [Verrucomicrobiae bacterium]